MKRNKIITLAAMSIALTITQAQAVDCTVFPSSSDHKALEIYYASCIGPNMGVDGLDGIDGIDGADGVDGIDGSDGADGTDGVDGTDGTDGVDGADGADGVAGADGKDGKDGIDGVDGADGESFNFDEYTEQVETYRVELAEYQDKLDDTFQYAADAAAGNMATAAIDFGNVGIGQSEGGIGFGISSGSYGSTSKQGYAIGVGIKHGISETDAVIAKGWYAGHESFAIGGAVTRRF